MSSSRGLIRYATIDQSTSSWHKIREERALLNGMAILYTHCPSDTGFEYRYTGSLNACMLLDARAMLI